MTWDQSPHEDVDWRTTPRVLIADDSPDARMLIRATLERFLGAEVVANAAVLDDGLAEGVGTGGDARSDDEVLAQEWTDEALQETRMVFEHTFDAARVGLALITPAGRLVRMNRTYREMLGREREKI